MITCLAMETKILAILFIAVLISHTDFATATTTSNSIVQDPCDESNISDKNTQEQREQRKTACQYQQKSKFVNADSQPAIQSESGTRQEKCFDIFI